MNIYNKCDTSSLSNFRDVTVTHINITWNIDFVCNTLSGCVDHSIKVLVDGTREVHFDSSKIHLDESNPVLINHSLIASFRKEDPHEVLGSRIIVEVPESLCHCGSTFTITFRYSVDQQASAVQWLPATATQGSLFPFVFTQCQAIHARSLLPCMDSPAVKATYTAAVTAPNWCTILMSALHVDSNVEEDFTTFYWSQPVPISSYLIALAGGRLAFKDISDRVRIWGEPEVIEAAHFEFSETEAFLQIAEEITGCKYQWTRYDVLCMPPSFPYGGTENACITFATPTLLAGDKSLADVIAHEIAHSWTGNLVTNFNWDNFWLNEGWTMWLERKIIAAYYRNDEYGILSAQIGFKMLQDSVSVMGPQNPHTALVWELGASDPDIAYSSVPYEKGFCLLHYMESVIGSDVFLLFTRHYINSFKGLSLTSREFKDFFIEFAVHYFSENPSLNSDVIVKTVLAFDWEKIFKDTGMPSYTPCFDTSLSTSAMTLANKWIQHVVPNTVLSASKSDIEGWGSMQICSFLEALADHRRPDGCPYVFDLSFLQEMDAAYGLSKCQNAEIKFRWQLLCLRSNAPWIVPYVIDFITSQGRMKYVRPLYRALGSSAVGSILARKVFENNKYHPISRKMLESDLDGLVASHLGNQNWESESDSADELFLDNSETEDSTESDNLEGEDEDQFPFGFIADDVEELKMETITDSHNAVSSGPLDDSSEILSNQSNEDEEIVDDVLEDETELSSDLPLWSVENLCSNAQDDSEKELDMFAHGESTPPVETAWDYTSLICLITVGAIATFYYFRKSSK